MPVRPLQHPSTPCGPDGVSGGEGGIRTHEDLRPTAFRERHLQPLGHLSQTKNYTRGSGRIQINQLRFAAESRTAGNPREALTEALWRGTQATLGRLGRR